MLSQSFASYWGETKLPGAVRSRRPQERRTLCHVEQILMSNQRDWLRLQKPKVLEPPRKSCLGTCGKCLQTAQSSLEGALPFEDLGKLSNERNQNGVGSKGPSLGPAPGRGTYTPPSATTGPSTQPPPAAAAVFGKAAGAPAGAAKAAAGAAEGVLLRERRSPEAAAAEPLRRLEIDQRRPPRRPPRRSPGRAAGQTPRRAEPRA